MHGMLTLPEIHIPMSINQALLEHVIGTRQCPSVHEGSVAAFIIYLFTFFL